MSKKELNFEYDGENNKVIKITKEFLEPQISIKINENNLVGVGINIGENFYYLDDFELKSILGNSELFKKAKIINNFIYATAISLGVAKETYHASNLFKFDLCKSEKKLREFKKTLKNK